MIYNFTERINRKGTGSHKWDEMYDSNPNVEEGVLPLSVADMEFYNPPEIYEGLVKYLRGKPILGYTGPRDEFLQAVIDWQERRHNWIIKKEWIVSTLGIVAALNIGVRALTKENDGVIIFKPVYYPFSSCITNNNRKEVNVPLIEKDGHYSIDFEEFEKEAKKPENKMLIFCSPHNPVGRVWTKEELKRLADIVVKHELILISDEIWYDFVRKDKEHTVLHKVNTDLQDLLITCTAASKSFNLAGLSTSSIIISNEKLRNKFEEEAKRSNLSGGNILGFEATRIAYTECEKWLEELIELVFNNQEMVKDFFEKNYPKIKAPVSEGTYLQWLDFRQLNMTNKELEDFLHRNQFFTNQGNVFGKEGNGYERINVALPQDALQELLESLLVALRDIE